MADCAPPNPFEAENPEVENFPPLQAVFETSPSIDTIARTKPVDFSLERTLYLPSRTASQRASQRWRASAGACVADCRPQPPLKCAKVKTRAELAACKTLASKPPKQHIIDPSIIHHLHLSELIRSVAAAISPR